MRITPEEITSLKEDEVFVFGSNLRGVHGAGAAKTALQWGAQYGNPRGLQGKTYAIPTKDRALNTLPIREIARYVSAFMIFASRFPEKKFLVTAVGCGLAGYTPEDIAPLFRWCVDLENVWLPESFWKILKP
jgi:hypothetical protein